MNIIFVEFENEIRDHLNADAMNINAKYTAIPNTPHLNHNLADSSRSSI